MDGDLRLLTIIGIVGDVRTSTASMLPPRPTVYVNLFQRPRSAITIAMLSDAGHAIGRFGGAGNPADLNPEIPAKFQTFSQIYSASLGQGDSTSSSLDFSESPRCCSLSQACLA